MRWRDAGFADGALVFYFADDGTQAEWGVGTLRYGPPNTVSRDTVLGNTAGTTARLNFLSAIQCYNELPGERQVYTNSNTIVSPGTGIDPHAGGVPIGASMDYWGTVAPPGWQFCDGRLLSRITYAGLFAVIGTTYGAGDGINTFAVPDCQGAVTYGKNTPASGGVTTQTRLGPWQNSAMGTSIGDWRLDTHTHALTLNDPGHAHTVSDPGHTHVYSLGSFTFAPGIQGGADLAASGVPDLTSQDTTNIGISGSLTGITGSVANAGSGIGFQNVTPGIVCNRIIYAGPVP